MKKNFISILLVTILLTTLVPTVALGSAPASGKLMLYSSLPVTQLDLMIDMFNEKYPNITVDVFSADSADVFARAQAEAGVTGGLVLGGNLESFRSAQNLFTAYTTSNAKNFHEQYASVENAAFTNSIARERLACQPGSGQGAWREGNELGVAKGREIVRSGGVHEPCFKFSCK